MSFSLDLIPRSQEEVAESLSSDIDQDIPIPPEEVANLLVNGNPQSIEEYSEHLHKISIILFEGSFKEHSIELKNKFYSLMDRLEDFINLEDPIHSKLYLIVERNFDIFIKISIGRDHVDLSTRTIRFLTRVIMNLNYWEVYNLLTWKPAIYHFLTVIQFDLSECYAKFISDYSKYNSIEIAQEEPVLKRTIKRTRREREETPESDSSTSLTNEDNSIRSSSNTPSSLFLTSVPNEEHDKFVSESLAGLTPKEKKRIRADAKLAAHRVIKKPAAKPSNKSSNYDPDVVHECQLPSADEPGKLCLRRFSRKYELIRHQETVHSKKKKLFKCYVCVKQNPNIGPRIFTRHDTLAKHIRVNHKISGKEAKAEVAYSKKHAEVVEEGDITVHVGRRKTKVDFELRAHMEKRKMAKGPDYDDSGNFDSNIDISDDEILSE
ncbi:uncharacterized protein PRCAT00005967001 [Priceomyces carsonii]|uniref:uncharacterized protein n=1 Tax=Priceomyces carsonii TaxID=28549 RepID=UPI002EDA3D59|nr:unnamed protein product [Priceomyces carsonii]